MLTPEALTAQLEVVEDALGKVQKGYFEDPVNRDYSTTIDGFITLAGFPKSKALTIASFKLSTDAKMDVDVGKGFGDALTTRAKQAVLGESIEELQHIVTAGHLLGLDTHPDYAHVLKDTNWDLQRLEVQNGIGADFESVIDKLKPPYRGTLNM